MDTIVLEWTRLRDRMPVDVQAEFHKVVEVTRHRADQMVKLMERQLKQVPIYDLLLRHVFGLGPVIAAYLVTYIRVAPWTKPDGTPGPFACKPSALRRFCGMAVIDGQLERPTKGQKLGYSAEMRMRLFQMFSGMWRLAGGGSTKYLKVWKDYKVRMQQSERVRDRKVKDDGTVDGKITRLQARPGDTMTLTEMTGKMATVSARGFIHQTGWHKAADVFLEDLYMVWRAIEGQPVWPSYYAAQLGYEHGGKIIKLEPRLLTVEQALELVGPVGRVGEGAEVDTDAQE